MTQQALRRAGRDVLIQQLLQQRGLQFGDALLVGIARQFVAQHQTNLTQQGEIGLER
ncbi:hypothetical protein D9M70_501830 [compost metagenome]